MLNKPFDQIDKAYIESLIADRVFEAKHLDYKETLPGDTEKDKNRFAEDVCAFANAGGGDIIFGMRDTRDAGGQKTGSPEYVGLKELNFDQEKLRLEHTILNKAEPRIPGIQFRPLTEGFVDGPVLVMRIPRSYSAPHMTKHDGRFRSRTDSGNYAMDVQEIRNAFLASETLAERIKQFRAGRLARIVAGETAVRLPEGPQLILHVVPLSAFSRKEAHDLSKVHESGALVLTGGGEFNSRHNFDGLLIYAPATGESRVPSYKQLFRDGIIETADADLIQRGSHEKGISCAYEEEVLSDLRNTIDVQQELGVELPLIVMISLLGVRGYRIVGWDWKHPEHVPFPGHGQIDRDDLLCDDIVIEQYPKDLGKVMRPVFDTVANAAGWSMSMNYDEDGNRVKPRQHLRVELHK